MPSKRTDLLTPLQAFLLLRYTLIAATAYLVLIEGRLSVPPTWICLAIAMALVSAARIRRFFAGARSS